MSYFDILPDVLLILLSISFPLWLCDCLVSCALEILRQDKMKRIIKMFKKVSELNDHRETPFKKLLQRFKIVNKTLR